MPAGALTPTCKSSFQLSAEMLDVVLLVKGDIKHFVARRPNPFFSLQIHGKSASALLYLDGIVASPLSHVSLDPV